MNTRQSSNSTISTDPVHDRAVEATAWFSRLMASWAQFDLEGASEAQRELE